MYKMINKKYVQLAFQSDKNLKTWLEKINASNTLSKTKFLFYFLEKSIRWDSSFRQKSECAICCSTNSSLNSVLLWIKAKCVQCDTVYHLNCLKNSKQSNQKSEENPETALFIQNSKNERALTGMCFKCNLEHQKELLLEEEKENQAKVASLNSIEKGNHTLRFNKTRVSKYKIFLSL
jgi:hypothetical protein